jgi:hypothetical protein
LCLPVLREAVGTVAVSHVWVSLSNHEHEEMAVRDCIGLLGYSIDELGWSLDAMAEPVDGAELEEETEHDTASGGVRKGTRVEDDLHDAARARHVPHRPYLEHKAAHLLVYLGCLGVRDAVDLKDMDAVLDLYPTPLAFMAHLRLSASLYQARACRCAHCAARHTAQNVLAY